jgi:phage-related protein
LTNALKLLGVTIAALKLYQFAGALQPIITGLRGASVATAVFKAALTGLKTAGIVSLFVLAALALEDLFVTLNGGESAFEPIHNAIGKFLAEDVAAFIAGLLSMDPDELNLTIIEFFTQTIPDAYNWMVEDFEATIANFVNFFTTVWSALSADFTTAIAYWVEFFGDTFGDLVDIADEVFNAIFAIVAAFGALFQGKFSEALGHADNAAKSFLGAIEETVEGVFNLLSNVGESIALALQSVEGTAVDIFKGVYEAAKQWVGGAIDWIWQQLKSIPFFDELVGGGQIQGGVSPKAGDNPPSSGGGGFAPPQVPPALPTASVAVVQAAANTTSQTSSQQINFAPQMTVNQLPGEDGENFARRVSDLLAEKAGEAVRNNDKGIVR